MIKNKREAIFEAYKNYPLGKHKTCLDCQEIDEIESPNSIYYIGEEFNYTEDTILFVGKTAISDAPGIYLFDSFIDATKFGEESLDLDEPKARGRAYYNYTNEIIKRYYGTYEEGKKYVALTNMVKCNNGTTKDSTHGLIKLNCITNLGVIWKEVEILQPRRIVFYTYTAYDELIDKFRPEGCPNYTEIEDDEQNCWWHRQYYNENKTKTIDILRTYHPQRKNKEKFVSKVVSWLQKTKSNGVLKTESLE
jgi:hypothetical protein